MVLCTAHLWETKFCVPVLLVTGTADVVCECIFTSFSRSECRAATKLHLVVNIKAWPLKSPENQFLLVQQAAVTNSGCALCVVKTECQAAKVEG